MEGVLISVGISIGAFVPMLLLLVVVHEFGHFATARRLGVKVLEFGIGFPPRAFGIYTGKTRVLIDQNTRFVNLAGVGDLRTGLFVKVASADDPQGNLVARVVEAPPPSRGLVDRLRGKGESSEKVDPDEYLKHEGKIRAVDGESFLLADMLYSMNWTPLGGFVRLAGESNPDVPRSLAGKGVGTRFLVLVAGPLMNALLPIAVFTVLFMIPQDVLVGQVEVTEVVPGSAAQVAGVQPGDVIVQAGGHTIDNQPSLIRAINLNGGSDMEWQIVRKGREQVIRIQPRFELPEGRWLTGIGIDDRSGQVVVVRVMPDSPAELAGVLDADVVVTAGGRTIKTTGDLIEAIKLNRDAEMDWLINRGGREVAIQVTPRFNQQETKQWLSGVSTRLSNSYTESRSNPPWIAFRDSFVNTWELLVLLKQGLTGAVSDGFLRQLSGPIGIAQITGEVTRQGGLSGWLAVTVFLSINLAILNILPIPMLDGGRLVFVVLEWVRRGKRISPEREGLVHLIGFALLIGVILLISVNDINRLIQGRSFLGG